MTTLRSALFNAIFFPFTFLTVVAGLPLCLLPPRVVRAHVRNWARVCLWLLRVVCGTRLRVTGMEHVPAEGPCLLAAKHQSAFDTIVWLVLLPRATYVMKKELLDLPLWGVLARHAGSVGVDRSGGGAALKAMVRGARAAAARGEQIVIFPEGTRTAPGERGRWQPGVAALAADDLPVIPAATDAGLFWGRRAFAKRPGTITIAVLPPLPPGLPRARLMAELEERVEAESQRLYERSVDKSVQ